MGENIAANDGRPMLAGLRIVDMTTIVFGPYATQILGDFEAQVTKVEAPGGDFYRYAQKPAQTAGMSPGFIALNRNKRSIVLDLKDDADAGRMREMLREADVFIHNVRADAIAKLGFDHDSVRAINPKIVYVHCVGFGAAGRYGGLQAYDDVIQAASGAASLLPRADGNPAPRYLPSLIADKVAGLHAAYATMAALIHRLRTGEGQFVEVPMFEAFAGFMLKEHLAGATFDPPVGPQIYERQVDPDRQPFPTSDGHISIVPYRLEHFPKVIALMGDPDFAGQERFENPRGIMEAGPELYRKIAQLSGRRSTAEWLAVFEEAGIPAMAVRRTEEVPDDPHMRDVDFFATSQHPTEGTVRQMREPSRFSAWDAPDPGDAPLLGSSD